MNTHELIVARDHMIEKARKAEAAATARTAQVTNNARRSLELRDPKFRRMSQIEQTRRARDLALEWRKTDAVWKGHVADNQWFIQQAIMYGTAVNGDLLLQLVSQNTSDGVTSRSNPAYQPR